MLIGEAVYLQAVEGGRDDGLQRGEEVSDGEGNGAHVGVDDGVRESAEEIELSAACMKVRARFYVSETRKCPLRLLQVDKILSDISGVRFKTNSEVQAAAKTFSCYSTMRASSSTGARGRESPRREGMARRGNGGRCRPFSIRRSHPSRH